MSAATCAERPACPVCGRHYEDGHDAPTHATRTLCDGSTGTLAEAWTTREAAAACLGIDVRHLRNYEVEDALSRRIGGAWVVAGPCPRNGEFTASCGLDAPPSTRAR